jgi:hypothetical protein
VESSCEHDNEPSSPIKCWEVLVAEELVASEEGLRTMKLVSYVYLVTRKTLRNNILMVATKEES